MPDPDIDGLKSAPDLADPAWFLDHLDIESGQARFVKVDRDQLSRQAFLDPRWSRQGLAAAAVAGSALDAPPSERPRLNFVWHTSFCCSTVLAALLDRPGLNLSLKEPRALVDLADLKRRQQGLKRPGLARSVLGLYGRRFSPGEQILIKPSNFANNLILDAAQMTDGRMLMLYSSCRSFLISILKAGESRRSYVRELFVSLAADGHCEADWPMPTLLRLSDLHMAALVWRMQMRAMQTAMASLGDRAASLDGDMFLERPREALTALDGFFRLGFGADAIQDLTNGPRLGRDVKTGADGAGVGRAPAEADSVEGRFAAHLDSLVSWANETSGSPGNRLPKSLI
jgi:hypothetical protein